MDLTGNDPPSNINWQLEQLDRQSWKTKTFDFFSFMDYLEKFFALLILKVHIQAIICAGLYPNVAKIEGGNAKGRPVWYDGKREVHIHPSSVNSNQKAFQYPFLVFLEKVHAFWLFLSGMGYATLWMDADTPTHCLPKNRFFLQ